MAKLHRDNAGYIGCSHEETQDPYYSYNKLSLPLSGATETVQRPADVTYTLTAANGKFLINGVAQASLSLIEGGTYFFDQSHSSNSTHPFKFSQTADGTHNRGTEYTTGVTHVGTRGTSGAYTVLVVPFGGLNLFYYCQQHDNMGGSVTTPANAGMFTAALPILKTTDQFGATLGSGVADDPFAANLVYAVPMNGSNNGTAFTDQSAAIKGSGSAKVITRNNAVTSTAQSIYYGSSGYFDGTNDSLITPNSSDFDFGTGDFTIEQWVYQTEQNNQYYVVNAKYVSGQINSWWWAIYNNYSYFFYYSATGSGSIGSPNTTIPLNTWTHLAVSRKNGILRLIQNGVVTQTQLWPHSMYATPAHVTIGADYDVNYDFKGYISDTRIYKGVGKYQPEESGDLGFQALSYIGTGNAVHQIGASGNGLNIPFKPDFVWLKNDGSTTGHHCLYDSVRGVYKHLQTSSTATEYTENTGRGLSAFNSDGFTIDTSNGDHVGEGNINVSGQRYSAYAWKAGGAATTITAGSIHSAATNSAQTWSSNITTTGNSGSWYSSYPATHIFDATTTNYGHANGDGSVAAVVTLSFSPAITCNSSVSFFGGLTGSGTGTISINGGTAFNLTTGSSATTKTTVAFSGSISSIVVTKTATGGEGLLVYGFEIDGIRLTDGTAFTIPAVPSLASSVSTSSEYGFSIGTYSGTGSLASVAHNLGAVPELLICKGRNGPGLSWATQFLGSGNSYFEVNSQGGNNTTDASNAWGADSTEHVFSIKTKPTTNETPANGNSFVFYAWKSVPGFSKISSYMGTGASGNVVTTGFRPSFLLIKADIDGEDWIIMDDARTPVNPVNDAFFANNGTVPNAISVYSVDFNDDGFTVNNNNPRFNTNTKTYYYMAIAGRKPSDPGQDAFKILETLNPEDLSSSAHTVTNNGASFQTSVKKFYDGAAYLNGSSVIDISASSDYAFGSGDFTIEYWINTTVKAADSVYRRMFVLDGPTGDTGANFALNIDAGSGHVTAWGGNAGPGNIVSQGVNITDGVWHHVACVRQGTTVSVFVDGSIQGTGTDNRALFASSNPAPRLGGLSTSTGRMNGYMQDVRVYKGIAKYTTSFSPPERSIQGTARRYPSGIYVVS